MGAYNPPIDIKVPVGGGVYYMQYRAREDQEVKGGSFFVVEHMLELMGVFEYLCRCWKSQTTTNWYSTQTWLKRLCSGDDSEGLWGSRYHMSLHMKFYTAW